ncbi:hypothetical protein VE23_15940 [Paenibacillus sp. D9]|uniref:hypothetical protein n=1 Tax=Paenibacillus TaxID=44249 RepID=UPI00061E1B78|nr:MULTISPECIES: hypothetical protein [Paenibacillus]KKC48231.1 hypothetical protein VE23_15940 [Paenibacillus sp. D9]
MRRDRSAGPGTRSVPDAPSSPKGEAVRPDYEAGGGGEHADLQAPHSGLEPQTGQAPRPSGRQPQAVPSMLVFSLLECLALYPVLLLGAVFPTFRAAELPTFLPPLLLGLIVLALHAAAAIAGSRVSLGPAGRLAKAFLALAGAGAGAWIGLRLFPGSSETAEAIRACVWGFAAGAAAVRGLIAGRRSLWNQAAPMLVQVGMLASFVLYIVVLTNAYLKPYAFSVQVSFTLALCLYLLRLNRLQIQNAAGKDGAGWRGTPAMRYWNRLLTGSLVALMLVIGAWQGLADSLRHLRDAMLAALRRPPAEQGLPPLEPQQPPAGEAGPMQLPEAKEPNEWIVLIGNILIVIVLLIAAVLLAYFLYLLLRRILPERIRQLAEALFRRLKLLRSLKPPSGSDYTDEVIKLERVPRKRKKRSAGRKAQEEPQGDGGDPRMRYRSFIRGAIAQGYEYRPSLTPEEHAANLSAAEEPFTSLTPEEAGKLAQTYGEARYGKAEDRARGRGGS